jgi:hypothetical protein
MFEVHAHVSVTSASVDSFIHIVMVYMQFVNNNK